MVAMSKTMFIERRIPMGSRSRIISAIALCLLQGVAFAATLHVEKWGSDASAHCGAKASPCLSIGQAISQASKNDRIRVGPGIYEENLAINIEGLKLESTAGRHGTAIWAALDTLPAVTISVIIVRFGKPGKGFTVHRSTTNTMFTLAAGVLAVNADKLKLEGNLAFGNRVGFILSGDRIQIRDNIIEDNDQEGIICNGCPRVNITSNRIGDNFRALDIIDSPGMRFERNYLSGNSLSMSIDNAGDNSSILNNVSYNNVAEGLRIDTGDGVTIKGNIASVLRDDFAQDNGLNARELPATAVGNAKPLRIEHNLFLGFNGHGFSVRDFADASIRNNHALQNQFSGIRLEPDAALLKVNIRNNAGYANDSSCSIENVTTVVMQVFNQFIGTGTPCGPLDYQGGIPPRPATLNINRARRL